MRFWRQPTRRGCLEVAPYCARVDYGGVKEASSQLLRCCDSFQFDARPIYHLLSCTTDSSSFPTREMDNCLHITSQPVSLAWRQILSRRNGLERITTSSKISCRTIGPGQRQCYPLFGNVELKCIKKSAAAAAATNKTAQEQT